MCEPGKILVLFSLCLIPTAGCGPPKATPPNIRISVGETSIGPTTAQFGSLPDHLVVLVWLNFKAQGGEKLGSSSSSTSTTVHCYGNSRSADGARVTWQLETSDGKSGNVTINGVAYDLANGRLFLVNAKGKEVQVRQLKRDLPMPAQRPEDFEALAKSDPEVAAFVAAAGKVD